jgi:nitroreductase
MNIIEGLKSRVSVRGYLKKEVEREKIERILEAARYAPSGANTQPWQVAVVTGRKRQEITEKMIEAFGKGDRGEKDYSYYPEKWKEPFKGRRIACGQQLYATLGIERKDRKQRMEQWKTNYRGFDAPVLLFFFMDPSLATGSFMDYGMFLQSIMLAALEEGLVTCPQAALAEYTQLVKESLDYPNKSILVCGMALGYEDKDAKINSYRTPRLSVSEFTRFYS